MGKRAPDQSVETEVNCSICKRPYSPDCDYRQGRCPHHPSLINLEKFMQQPDPQKHFILSLIKSSFRIAAGISLIWPQNLVLAGIFLIFAEAVGVAEEMV